MLLSVGLVPENELSIAAGWRSTGPRAARSSARTLQTAVAGVFACGNVLHVHDLVDFVSEEAERCGAAAAAYLDGAVQQPALGAVQGPARGAAAGTPRVVPGTNIRYVVPNAWQPGRQNVLYCRPLVVKNGAVLAVRVDGREIRRRKLAHVQPSEMIRVGLEPAELPAIEPGQPNVLEVSLA